MNDVIPTRTFNLAYLIADSIFILGFVLFLIFSKRRITVLWSLFGGVLYWVVDFVYFYLISQSRTIYIDGVLADSGMTCLVLVWMSLSYGITNFAFIWLCLSKDRYLPYWIGAIIVWWLLAPLFLNIPSTTIKTVRTTSAYHWPMLVILLIGYAIFIVWDQVKNKAKWKTLPLLLKLNAIGISVQLLWEAALFIGGIRPHNELSYQTLIIDSLIETNLGMPYTFFIHLLIYRLFQEDGKRLSVDASAK